MARTTIKIVDLLQVQTPVEISAEQQIMVRPLSLQEMITLLIEQTDNFLLLYSRGVAGELTIETLTPILLSCPELVAKIIAYATDEPNEWKVVQTKMSATVQLIALSEIWKLSVPDPKKAQELLSGVTGLLQKLSDKNAETPKNKLPNSLSTESLQPSSTLSTVATD